MFASISRGSSRVRKTYICSSCLCNAVVQSSIKSSVVDRGSNIKKSPFSTASPNAQVEDGTANALTPAPAAESSDSKSADKSAKSSKTNISNSQATLKALRASLIAEDNKKAINKFSSETIKKQTLKQKKAAKKLLGGVDKKSKKGGANGGNATESTNKVEDNTDNNTVEENKTEPEAVTSVESPTEEKPINNKPVSLNPTSKNPSTKRRRERRAKERADAAAAAAKISGTESVENTEYTEKAPAKKPRPVVVRRKLSTPSNHRGRGAKQRPLVITRILSGDSQNDGASPDSLEAKELMDLVQSGRLSGQERLNALKHLRSKLLHRQNTASPEQSLKSALLSIGPWAGSTAGRVNLADRSFGNSSSNLVQRLPNEPRPREVGPITRPGPQNISPKYENHEINTIDSDELQLVPMENDGIPVPALAYGLERVLFNPGVYQLQDPRTRVFNFDPYLQTIMPVNEFDFNALKQYVTSSKDTRLLGKTRASKKKYTGSTSSMTSALAHFHFLLSQWREPNFANLSKTFPLEYKNFTRLQRGPCSIFLRYKDGVYAIDADKQYDTGTILSMLGKSMEKLLTLSRDEFERYRRANSDQISEEERNASESFHYTTMGDFMMRSQLDAYDPRLPGTGMFDLKTRAVISVRMDTDSHEQGSGYQIKGRHGEWESFEREYCDMIRAAFLKYSLQVRMGRMDGIFVAYHNTKRIFGFQYISLEEMDYAIHGTEDLKTGDQEFKLSLELLNRALDRATAKWPEQSLRMHFETRDGVQPFMYIFATPMSEEVIEQIQTTNKSKVEKFESEMLGLSTKDLTDEERNNAWDDFRAKVEEEMKDDEKDFGEVTSEHDARQNESLHEGQEVEEIKESQGLTVITKIDIDAPEVEGVETSDNVEQKRSAEPEEISDEELQQLEQELMLDGKSAGNREQDILIEDNVEETPKESASLESKAAQKVNEESLTSPTERGEESETAEFESPIEENDKFQPVQSSTVSEVASLAENNKLAQEAEEEEIPHSRPDNLLAMTLTIRNKVDGKYVERPENLTEGQKWEVEYALAEIPDRDRAQLLYKAAMKRRRAALTSRIDLTGGSSWNDQFLKSIKQLSVMGKEWREMQDKIEENLPLKTLDMFKNSAIPTSTDNLASGKDLKQEIELTAPEGSEDTSAEKRDK
jgi:hypothetical protein